MRVIRWIIASALVAAAVPGWAADPPPVPPSPALQPKPYDGTGGPRSVVYRRTLVTASNEKFGTVARGWWCSNPQPLLLTSGIVNAIGLRFGAAARRELRGLGYLDALEEQSAFSRSATPNADYELAGSVRGIEAHFCSDGPRSTNGGVWMQVRWELFASKQQRVVHSVTTEGSYATAKFAETSIDEVFEAAFGVALRNALADATMASQLRSEPATAAAAAAAVASSSWPRLSVASSPGAGDQPDAEFTIHRSAVVTVMSGVGAGSGFYIDPTGYLLTNHHIVGDAKYVKIRLASGREIVGEVVRSDAPRDVALVKTEAVALRALPVASQPPGVGDEVVAIGSPYGETFASSLSKGVLSGTAMVRDFRFLQSDVKVLPGSSGGPLVRRDGAVVGIVQGGVGASPGAAVNLFVPIDEALSRLSIDIRR